MGRARGARHIAAARRRASQRTGGRGPYRWTDDRIRSELEAYVEGLDEFPSLARIDADRPDLRAALVRNGSAAWWAEQVGMPLPPHRQRG